MAEYSAKMKDNRAPHASPACSEADQAGTFLCADSAFVSSDPRYFPSNPASMSPAEALRFLQSKGLDIAPSEEPRALDALKLYGYSRLSGFWTSLERDGVFIPGASFRDVLNMVALDQSMRMLLLDMIAHIEIALRSVLSRVIAEKHGPFALHDAAVFANREYFEHLQVTLERELAQGKAYQLSCIEPSLRNYGALPVWEAVELMSFGTVSKVFSNLACRESSVAVAERFGVKPPLLRNWLRYITQVRNMCAHQNRLYGCRFVFTPRLFSEHTNVNKNRLFPVFIVLFHLMDAVDAFKADACRTELDRIVRASSGIDLRPLGFPHGWRALLSMADASQAKAPRVRGKRGGRPAVDAQALACALYLYDMKEKTVAQIAECTGISQSVIYKYVRLRRERDKV